VALSHTYWANPSYGLPDTPGVFTKVSFNDVDFFGYLHSEVGSLKSSRSPLCAKHG
jgi:hypothetical protein